MAEVVERNLEDSVNEVLCIKKTKLFSRSELNEVIRKRRNHEYSIQKRNKRISDYDTYINSELTILKLIRFRRELLQDDRFVDKIEKSIISRLVRLHRQLCYRFQSHIDLWIRFIHFCRGIGRHLSVVRLWKRVLQVHGRTEPRLWAAAASYHLHCYNRAKSRAELRSFSERKSNLIQTRRKLKQELKLLNRFTSDKDKHRIAELLKELRENEIALHDSIGDLDRERRLVWDRSHLHAIRESRRLLTEGLSFNPECEFLRMELIKLEINAIDFFKTRILRRLDATSDFGGLTQLPSGQEENAKASSEASLTSQMSSNRKRQKGRFISKKLAMDNSHFMAAVTENISFIVSGGALIIVIQDALSRWSSNLTLLESLHQLVSKVSHLISPELVTQISDSLSQAKQSSVSQPLPQYEDKLSTKTKQLQLTLANRLVELHQTLMNGSVLAALDLWDNWYSLSSSTSETSFRFMDPNVPEAVGLLKARLHLAYLIDSCVNTKDDLELMQQKHLSKIDIIRKTRLMMDSLSTSHWGKRCPDFWLFYLKFEQDIGDCVRLPAIQWKARKVLDTDHVQEFNQKLVENF